jgi:hypothetical protein
MATYTTAYERKSHVCRLYPLFDHEGLLEFGPSDSHEIHRGPHLKRGYSPSFNA